jgi:hypothetical protein
MDTYEEIHTEERDGWHVSVSLAPDYDYRPGEDDETFPRITEAPRGYDEEEDRRDYDGRFLPRTFYSIGYPQDWSGYDRGTEYGVTRDELERVIRNGWGENVTEYRRRKMRRQILEDAAAIVSGDLTWCVVRVTVTADGAHGDAYLGGVDYDLRQKNPDAYILEDVLTDLFPEALEDAARAKVGSDAPLALGF